MYKKTILTISILLMIPVFVFSQGITTASLNGTVKDQSGEPLIGANIVVVHEPTGTTSGAASRTDGSFNIPNVRVGGPYTITVSYIGYKTEKQENIFLNLGVDLKIDFVLAEEAVQLAEIVTVAERSTILSASNTGTATNVTTAQIERLPTIERTIQDFTRLTPQVVATNIGSSDNIGGMNVAGKNNKFNNFQVDGAILNDAFGLPASGTPGGQANMQPISLDAIQEFKVDIAPYDVRSGGFSGGLINAITRSGSNQFSGSAYFFGRNQSFVGDLEGDEFEDFDDFQTGFRFSGPLVQNKVFFFVNGEIRRRDEPRITGINDPSAPINFPVPVSDMQRIVDITNNKYSYDPGGFGPFTIETNDVKIFARLDYNISDRHRITLRHNFVDGDLDRGLTRETTLFALASNVYQFDTKTNSTVLQLNSTFGNNLANEARVTYTTIRDKRGPTFAPFPQVEVDAGPGNVRLGVERFSQANALEQDIFEFTDNLMYFTGNHTFTIGTHNEFIQFDNLFIFDLFGRWEFASIDDYEAGIADRYSLKVSKVPGVERPRAAWDYIQLGFYAQDEWKATPKLNLTFGLRADIPIMPDDPLRNDLFASQFSGLRTDEVPTGNILWSPRFGFNYDVSEDRTTQLRGGVGLFAGLPPAVWLANQYGGTGVDLFTISLRGRGVPPPFEPDPFNQPVIGDPSSPQTAEIALTAPDFKMPQVLRTNIGIDHQLPQGLVGTLEFLYSKNINDIYYRNINIGTAGEPIGTLPDGRPEYDDNHSPDFTGIYLLDNTNKGFQWTFTAGIQKQLNRGPFKNLFGSIYYTHMDAEDVNAGKSSRAVSNWRKQPTIDPNAETASTSGFEFKHRILTNFSYQFKYGRGFGTTVSVFYESRSGRPFSYYYEDDANGDGFRRHDLIFVPASENDVVVTSGTWEEINSFIESDPALRDARGKIIERNAAREPWVNQLDLRIAQQIPTIRGQNFEITLDILNVLNLLNNDWGQQKFAPFIASSGSGVFNFDGYDGNGKPMISLNLTDTNGDGTITRDDHFTKDNILSRWQVQLGIRYSF